MTLLWLLLTLALSPAPAGVCHFETVCGNSLVFSVREVQTSRDHRKGKVWFRVVYFETLYPSRILIL